MKKTSMVKKLDGRRMINQRAASKRSKAGTQPKGVGLVIHGSSTSKRDPDLQKRIDMVVAMAQAKECDHSTDVINSFPSRGPQQFKVPSGRLSWW